MPLVTQTLWGALFCLPAGFSFTALRLSTLLLSLCSVLVVYLLARQAHPSRLVAGVATLTVGFNPFYYALSSTFMTDVPFTALLLAAAWFFSRTLQSGSDLYLLCGLACALAATLCRQLGLAAPVAFAVCLVWSRGLSARCLVRALLPLAVCLGALLAFQQWLRATGRMHALYSLKNQDLFPALCNPKRLASGHNSCIAGRRGPAEKPAGIYCRLLRGVRFCAWLRLRSRPDSGANAHGGQHRPGTGYWSAIITGRAHPKPAACAHPGERFLAGGNCRIPAGRGPIGRRRD